MIIKQYHNRQVKVLIIADLINIIVVICESIFFFENIANNNLRLFAVFLMEILLQLLFIYFLGFELKAYKVCDNGIYVKWFGLLCYLLEWSEIKYIRIEIVKQKSIENNSILVSKIPIKTKDYPIGINSYFYAVDYGWLVFRPSKVIAIYIDEMAPGQYEEFWSYVPEHLKSNYITQK